MSFSFNVDAEVADLDQLVASEHDRYVTESGDALTDGDKQLLSYAIGSEPSQIAELFTGATRIRFEVNGHAATDEERASGSRSSELSVRVIATGWTLPDSSGAAAVEEKPAAITPAE
jgi:hypothetical protein